ncbi:ABC transporter permease [Vibrio fluvialis]|jgi:ribose/xylose/arabinose/galactoside ABC-type transport system permease subunit|uniref:ABC transporter permease n=1 Tax=Vibrio fluvialis TaxID=676 RepID=A0AAX2LSU3_VIBFL|nr:MULTISPECIES: ABC transporter permease [Vibrio]AMF93015.1 ABC transporter permease [Vibrio fluvialis]EKO3909575.1 ABC transporter permease [Vibrio fluvialis]EKO4009683.1 ABC transporter permease [Vibrio fluvialis]ELM6620758.1 ABC transporter permease [Vibrio fluvialis]ELO1810655.1 ABC transporter permease [Vibrio fluvialis]
MKSKWNSSDILRVFLFIAIPVFFACMNSFFLTSGNLFALMQNFGLVGLVALGLVLTMIVGEFDLSVASMVAVGGLILAKTGVDSAVIGVFWAVMFGLVVGLINAAFIIKLKVSSLVSTLGMMILLSGFAYWIADGNVVPYYNFDASDVLDAQIAYVLSPRILITVAAMIVVYLLLSFTRLGRDLYATGSHRQSAIMSGANTSAALCVAFGCSGMLAALAGALISISLATGSPTLGDTLLIQAASAAILGGVSLGGGVGKIHQVAVGVMILAALGNGLSLMGASSATTLLVNGCVLGFVVLMNGDLSSLRLNLLKKTHG